MTYWLLSEFKPFAERQGLKLLKDDLRFIMHSIAKIPADKQRQALRGYVSIWKQHSDQNKGRYAANAFLRDMVE